SLRGRIIVLADRERSRKIPVEWVVRNARSHPSDLGARRLEVVLCLGGAGAVEQGFAALLGLHARQGKRPVEVERGFARLARGNPQIAGSGPNLRRPRILVRRGLRGFF